MSKIEKRIDKAAQEYAKSLWGVGMYEKGTPATEEDMTWAFKAGAKWALSHQWVSVEDALPPNDNDVLVVYADLYTNAKCIGIANYDDDDSQWYSADDDVNESKRGISYWMPIPPLPEARKEGEV